jgi:HEAT repeat protein
MLTSRVAYLQAVLGQTDTLSLPLREVGLSEFTLSLDAIALPLRMRHTPLAAEDLALEADARLEGRRPSPAAEQQAANHEDSAQRDRIGTRETLAANASEALSRSERQRMVILGSPGSGKTTTIKTLLTAAARSAIADETAFLPFFLSLPELAQYGQSLDEFLRVALGKMGASSDLTETLMAEFASGHAMICLDGLDEVAPQQRPAVISDINTWAAQPGGVWIVGSRFTEYKGGQFSQSRFDEWELEPLDAQTQLALAQRLLPALRQRFYAPDAAQAHLSATGFTAALNSRARGAVWGRNPLLFSLAAAAYARSGFLPASRSALYASVVSATLQTREADAARQAELLTVIELLALTLYRAPGRSFTRQSLLETMTEARNVVDGGWDIGEMATRTLGSGVIAPGPGETFTFTHQTIQEYLAGAALSRGLLSADPSRQTDTWALAWGKRTYTRWTETLRFMVGALSHEHGAVGEQETIHWLRALLEERDGPLGDPGDLGLALALTSLREVAEAGVSTLSTLSEEVISAWRNETRAALSSGTAARQERLIRMMSSELSILPDALVQRVVEVLVAGMTEARDRSIRALAAAALGELEERAPGEALAREITTAYHSDNYEAALKALARMGAAAPIDLLVEATEDQDFSDPEDQDEHDRAIGRAYEALGALAEHAPLDVLVRGLYSPHHCLYAAEGLGKVGARALPSLVEAAQSSSGLVRQCAMIAFTRLASLAPLEVLLAGLHDPERGVRVWAITALGQHGSPAAVEPLIACLRRERQSYPVRSALQSLAPSTPVEPFLPLLQDEDAEIRTAGLAIVAKMGSSAPIPRIVAMIGDPDTQQAALTALMQLNPYAPVRVFTAALGALASEGGEGIPQSAENARKQVDYHDASALQLSRDLVFNALADRDEPEATVALLAAYHQEGGSPSQALMQALACHAGHIPDAILHDALNALHRVDQGGSPILVKAIRAVGATDAPWRALQRLSGGAEELLLAAIQALETLGDVEPGDAVAEALLKALRTGSTDVWWNAYKALPSIGSSLPAQSLLATLRNVAHAEYLWPVATRALGERAPVADLLRFLESDDATLADAALAALMQITPSLSDEVLRGPVRAAMLRTMRASSNRHGYEICVGMTALGERALADVVVELAAVSDGMLQEDAYKSLVTVGSLALEPTLQLLASSEPHRHAVAVEILTRLANHGVTVPVEPLLQRLRADQTAYPTARALGALSNQGVAVPVGEVLSLLLWAGDDDSLHDYERGQAIAAFGKYAVPALIPFLGQEHPEGIRERALEALGSLRSYTPEEVFLGVVRDETMPARWEAATALGSLAADDPEGRAYTALVEAVSDSDPHLGAWAIKALRNAALPIPVAALVALVHTPGWSVGESAVAAMGYQRDPAVLPILTDLLRAAEEKNIRRKAAEALGRQAQQDVTVSLEPLTAALRNDEDERVRGAAFDALLSLGDRIPVDALLSALDDPHTSLRQHMIEEMVSQAQLVPDKRWLPLLGDADPNVQLLVASALASRHMARCFPVLLDLLDEASDQRWAVQRAITGLGMSALPGLRHAQEDVRPLVRGQATILMNEIVSAQREEAEIDAIPSELVAAALGDPEVRIRASMLATLAKRRDVYARALILAAIGDSVAEVRSAAFLGLKRLSAEVVPEVVAEAVAILRDGEVGVHFDALTQSQVATLIERATGDDGRLPPPLIAILTNLLSHSYWNVRAQAATALGKVRRGIPDLALRRLTGLLRDQSRAVSRAAEDALAQVLSLEAGIEDAD